MGKSWLSCALAHKACRDGYAVYYARAPRLFADLELAHGDGRFARLFRMLVKVDLLILDLCAARSYVELRSAGRTEAGFDCCSTPHNIRSRGHSRFSQSTILTATEVT